MAPNLIGIYYRCPLCNYELHTQREISSVEPIVRVGSCLPPDGCGWSGSIPGLSPMQRSQSEFKRSKHPIFDFFVSFWPVHRYQEVSKGSRRSRQTKDGFANEKDELPRRAAVGPRLVAKVGPLPAHVLLAARGYLSGK